jgi:formylglycine-generating enzyme required for sulfatase activity
MFEGGRMRPLVLAAVLGLNLLTAALAARAQTPPPDPAICTSNLRDYSQLAPGNDYQAMERLLARTPNACRQLRAQIQARITALRPPPAVDACVTAEQRWASLRTSTSRDALQRFISDTPTRCAIREAAVQRLASLPAATPARPPATTTRPPVTQPTTTTWRDGQEFDDCSGAGWCPRMVVIPAGSFTMGSPDSETGRYSDEGPQRRVSIRQFAVGKFEVTFNEWDACVNRGGCDNSGPQAAGGDNGWGRGTRPMIEVRWDDARSYVQWLSRETGRTYRLLTEAEWEYAARAGTTTAYSTGASIATSQANFNNTLGRTQTVGAYAANAFGLHDMHGNVWEWVQDCYASSYSGLPTDGSAYEASSCSLRVVRGGSWYGTPRLLRSASRYWSTPTGRDYGLGFRVARTLN